jgi:RNA polymerase sigma factor (sigma-70 family)
MPHPKARLLVQSHLWIVEHFCAKYYPLGRSCGADLRAAGYHGLCEAAAKFESKKGKVFSTYAWNWVKGFMLRELRKAHVVPVPEHTARAANKSGAPVRRVVVFGVPDLPADDEQEQRSDRRMRLRALHQTVMEIDEPRRAVVRRALRGLSVAQIASALGLSQARVTELLEEAEAELKELMR